MNRRSKILEHCKKKGKGLEIGPSFNPIAPKSEGYDVDVLDHATADELKAKYAPHGVDITKIELVDFVCKGQPIDELVGRVGIYDWIIISHVIEHVPDIISFFRSCSNLLKPDGILSLAIPDKRYCFDFFRWPTSTGDVLQAWTEKNNRHRMGAVFDHLSLACKKGEQHAWGKMHYGKFSFVHDFSDAASFFRDYGNHNEYVDAHAWRFTPSSFRLILMDLKNLCLTDFSEVGFHDTAGCEFFVSLGRSLQGELGDSKVRLSLCERIVSEIAEQAVDQGLYTMLLGKYSTAVISRLKRTLRWFRWIK